MWLELGFGIWLGPSLYCVYDRDDNDFMNCQLAESGTSAVISLISTNLHAQLHGGQQNITLL